MLYEWIREGYDPNLLKWHSINDCLPKMEDEDYIGLKCSIPVLVFSNGRMLIGYMQRWNDDIGDGSIEWKLVGRSAHGIENVTHWRWLPDPPSVCKGKSEEI